MVLYFIHGSGLNSSVWNSMLEYFPESIAIDLPGHPEGNALDSVPQYAEWVAKDIESRGLQQQSVVVVGHSLGGGIALQLAIDYPQLVAGLVLLGSGARLRVLPSILDSLKAQVHEKADVLSPAMLSMNRLIPEPLKTEVDQAMINNGPTTMLADLSACDRFDVMERLAEVKVPCLIICGEQDVMTPPKYSRYLAEKLALSDLQIVPDGSHMLFAEKPELVSKAIQFFIESIETIPSSN